MPVIKTSTVGGYTVRLFADGSFDIAHPIIPEKNFIFGWDRDALIAAITPPKVLPPIDVAQVLDAALGVGEDWEVWLQYRDEAPLRSQNFGLGCKRFTREEAQRQADRAQRAATVSSYRYFIKRAGT